MDLGLDHQKVLITGSTAGIGFATALAFARERARVIVNGRTTERVRLAIDAIRKALPDADVDGVAADVATSDGIARITAAHPEVDVLVNNAAVYSLAAFEDIPDPEWFRLFETNVMSGVRLSRHYFPRMLQKGYGRIIFVSSESGASRFHERRAEAERILQSSQYEMMSRRSVGGMFTQLLEEVPAVESWC